MITLRQIKAIIEATPDEMLDHPVWIHIERVSKYEQVNAVYIAPRDLHLLIGEFPTGLFSREELQQRSFRESEIDALPVQMKKGAVYLSV